MSPYASQAWSLDLILRSSPSLRHALRTPATRRVRRLQAICRAASTISIPPDKNHSDGSQTSLGESNGAASVLRSARSFLASASRLRGKANSESDSVLGPLASVYDAHLTVDSKPKINVTVYSDDETSARDLVTALLDDPLLSDPALRSAIHDRWKTARHSRRSILRFQQADANSIDENAITLPSSFFTRFPHPIILQELYTASHSTEAIERILEADVPILVISPFHTPSHLLSSISLQNPHALVVVDSALNPASPSADNLRSQVASKYSCDASRVLLLDTARALRGAAVFSADPSSAAAVRMFQEDEPASGLPTLLRTLTETVSRGPSQLRADGESALTRRIVTAGKEIIQKANEETREVRGRSSALRESALEECERAEVEILGGDVDLVIHGEQGRVARGVERSATEVRPVLDGLAWYRLPFVVDDVSARVDSAVERAFAREFENDLIFHTGRLASLQAHLVSRTTSLLTSLPPTFHSTVLHNTLAQLTSAPSCLITSSSPSPSSSNSSPANAIPVPALLTPLRTRTVQLAHATRALHLFAQRFLLFTFSSTSVSAVGGAALFVNATLDAASAIGAGVLGALIGLRWAVGRWARARAAWWSAFSRVGDGLTRDLSATLKEVLDKQVCAVPDEACEGLQRLVERREQEIGEVEDELAKLEASLEALEEVGERETNGGQK